MMTEDHIEAFALARLEAMKYGYANGHTIAHPERESFTQDGAARGDLVWLVDLRAAFMGCV